VDAIPVQDIVDQFKARSIDLATEAVLGQVIALTGPLSGFFGPVIYFFMKRIVRWGVSVALDYLDKGLFNVNMEIVASDQASDWRKAEAKLMKAKEDPNLTDEYWEQLEYEANHKFEQLVNFTK
jgi:hypothetical protein